MICLTMVYCIDQIFLTVLHVLYLQKMINEREYVADESFESEASSDNDDQLHKRGRITKL